MYAAQRRYRQRRTTPRIGGVRTWIFIAAGGVAGLFVVANAILFAVYHNRTYPGTMVINTKLGSVAYSGLADKINSLHVLPQTIQLQHGSQKATVRTSELGITQDADPTLASAKTKRAWLPLVNLFSPPRLDAPIHMDTKTLDTTAKQLAQTFNAPPQNARLALSGGEITIASSKAGYTLDQPELGSAVRSALTAGKTDIDVPIKPTAPAVTAADLQDDKNTLEKQLAAAITFRYNSKTASPQRTDIAGWYDQSAEIYVLSQSKVANYITQVGKNFGIRVKDTATVASSVAKALADNKPLDVTLVATTVAKTYTYCTNVRGVSTSELPGLKSRLQSTYADARGWSLDGLIEFREVTSGCDFTVWLSAAGQMPSFGPICDSMWSCRSGPNVVINYDRWQNASPAWNQYGGTLEDYRHMVINHETGHWLGFGHAQCPGAGQLAPVMQQQSINLQGCTFNPWPTAGELATYRRARGL